MCENFDIKALDTIINLLKILIDEETQDSYTINHGGAKYLLGQTLRQLSLSPNKRYISLEADKLYKSLCIPDDQVFKYYYQMKVINYSEKQIFVDLYKGASKSSHTQKALNKGDAFLQREVFHDDHIIPIKLIIETLLKIKNPNHENVFNVVKDISICRMLKGEDRRLTRTKRPYDEKYIIENLYLEQNIVIKNYSY